MAIYGIGAFYSEDVSQEFIDNNIVGVGWNEEDAPELHQFIRALKVGDIIYIKSFPPSSSSLIIKGIGIVSDSIIRINSDTNNIVSCGRNVRWVETETFRIPKPQEKNNVRANTIYEEFNFNVQLEILNHLI